MRKAYKVRVYPDTEQAAQLSRTFGCVRLVWNKTLDARHRAYPAHGTKTAYRETDAALTVWKKTEDLAFLSEVSSVPLQQTLRHQHTAYASFFAGRAKYPRFKSRNGRQSAHYTRSAFRLRNGKLTLARNKVAGTYRKIRNARFDFLHRTSTRLIRENDVIAIEDLNVAGMSRSVKGTIDKPGRNVRAKAGLNRAVLDAAFGEFRRQLEYKAERAGKRVVVIDRWYPSSKTCSACGHLLSSLKLSVRHWRCPDCGTRHDRDHNAAKNILAAGLAVARESPGDACGAGVNLQGSSLRLSATKQELSGVSPMGIPAL